MTIEANTILLGDVRDVLPTLPDQSVQMCVSSPPYWGLRDYGTATWEGGDAACEHEGESMRTALAGTDKQASNAGASAVRSGDCRKCGARRIDAQLGLESTPEEYVANMTAVFREVRRVLRDDGVLWLNLGLSYASGDMNATQSPLLQRAPACGNDGKVHQDSQCADRAYPDSCDELQDESLIHHENIAHNDRSAEQGVPQTSRIAHDIEPEDCAQAFLGASHFGVLRSNIPASHAHVPGVSSREGVVSASQREPQTASADVHLFDGRSACIGGTSQMLPPLVVRTQGKESFFSACGRSDCIGIGKCGLCWCSLAIPSLNIKPKDEINITHLVAMALQADGWVLRQTICWHKPNPMPESVTDRCTKAHEYIFLLSKNGGKALLWRAVDTGEWSYAPDLSERVTQASGAVIPRWRGFDYYFDAEAIAEDGVDPSRQRSDRIGGASGHTVRHSLGGMIGATTKRNRRSVWTVASQPYSGAHFATFPEKLIEPCILAGCPAGGIVLDPFFGSGTTGQVCERLGRQWLGIELNPEYADMARRRTAQQGLGI